MFGTPPYTGDALGHLIDRRVPYTGGRILTTDPFAPPAPITGPVPLGGWRPPALPTGVGWPADPGGTPLGMPDIGVPGPPAPKKPGVLKQALASALGVPGQAGIAAGYKAGRETKYGSFGQSFLAGLAAGMSTSAATQMAMRNADIARAEQKRKADLEARRVAAEEKRAGKTAAGAQDVAQKLQQEYDFLKQLGATDDEIKQHFMTRGAGGIGGSRGGAFADRLATSLVATGRARNIDEARVLATRYGRNAQVVGQIEKLVSDPNNIDNFSRVRLNVLRTFDPLTNQYLLVDESGNQLTEQDLESMRANPGGFSGGTGGKPAPPQPAELPVDAQGRPLPVPSHRAGPQGRPTAAQFDSAR